MSTASAPSSAPGTASSASTSSAVQPRWHAMPADEVVAALGTHTRDGLADAEAARRLARDGPNLLPEGAHRGPLLILLAQFADFTVAVLAAAAILAGALGEPGDMVAILAILAINAVLGFVQEYRAERAVAALKDLAAPRARVRRDGATRTVAAALLVSGDLVRLEAGDMVAADLRLVEAADLRVAEAALTGESEAVGKQVAPVPGSARLGDRRGMAYKGTVVASGRGLGVVTATGMRTELGRIATLLAEVEVPRTPLQQRLARFTRRLALAVLAICAVLFTAGLLRGEPAGADAAHRPESRGGRDPRSVACGGDGGTRPRARRAAVRHALIAVCRRWRRSAPSPTSARTRPARSPRIACAWVAVRTAASRDADLPITGELPRDLLLALALSNDADVAADGTCAGDPTEVALLEAARSAGVEKSLASQALPRVAELPFTSARGRMTTVHAGPGRVVAFTKGAPEVVIDRCVRVADGPALDGVIGESRAVLHAAADRLAAEGMRVLAIAMRELPSLPSPLVAAEVEAS
jgi:Ca2+-transporting ATPase